MPCLSCSLVYLECSHLFCLQSGSLLLWSYSSQRLSAGISGRIEPVLVKRRENPSKGVKAAADSNHKATLPLPWVTNWYSPLTSHTNRLPLCTQLHSCQCVGGSLCNCPSWWQSACLWSCPHVSVQLLAVSDSATPWTTAHQASLSITNSWSLPKFMSIALVMPSSHLIISCPLLLCSIFTIKEDGFKQI